MVDKWVDVGTGELHINRYTTDSGPAPRPPHHARRQDAPAGAERAAAGVRWPSSFQLQADKYVRLASVQRGGRGGWGGAARWCSICCG